MVRPHRQQATGHQAEHGAEQEQRRQAHAGRGDHRGHAARPQAEKNQEGGA